MTAAEPWMIDELAHAGPEHLDPAFVAGFDRKQGHPDPAPDIDALRRHGVGRGATVVDLGAGTGRFALAAAREFTRVVAVDVSPAMLEHLRARAGQESAANLECVRAGFLTYEHTGQPADAVHTRHALHQLPDFFKALALDRVARTLWPGGVLRLRDLVLDFRPHEAGEVLEAWMAGAADDPALGYTRRDYAEHLRTEYSTFRWLLEPMLEAAGFEIVEAEYEGRLFGAYTCVRRP
ncbi:class I SAM-dependent methyltransferase [Streptomyces sp. S1A]|uniref:class I SAM-dependent methyltransferase n=1 Tax=Streptomyces sp. ICN903 TaxID=2964654 RepID=UPI001EDC63D5|nr:class I SAM-dependent methyltransferase [Streptomyces sp. ICN903]MCG3042293.1 class I SAM-dependent methyltransferase [Streptomyces sp. ICN903]